MTKPTPRTDALMRKLDRLLKTERGLTTQLARYLRPDNPRSAIIRICEYVGRRKTPNGETLLAIVEWMDGRRS